MEAKCLWNGMNKNKKPINPESDTHQKIIFKHEGKKKIHIWINESKENLSPVDLHYKKY